jgi:glycerophosphoryl diester phosphodiesterase
MHVDVKESGYETDLVAAISEVTPVFFTSGDDDAVRALRAIGAPACLTLGPSFAGRPVVDGVRDLVSAMLPWRRIKACDAVGVAAQFRIGWWGLRWWCRRHGLVVLIWTVNDDRRLRWLLRARGVTAVVTDRPGRAMALR